MAGDHVDIKTGVNRSWQRYYVWSWLGIIMYIMAKLRVVRKAHGDPHALHDPPRQHWWQHYVVPLVKNLPSVHNLVTEHAEWRAESL